MTQKSARLKFVKNDKFYLTFHLEEMVCSSRSGMGYVDWNYLAQHRNSWQAVVNELMNLRVLQNAEILFNPLTPNDPYSGRTAPLNSKRCILYIYSTI